MAVENLQQAKACGICSVVGHPTDMCPTLQEEPMEQVDAMGGFLGQPQHKYDPYFNTYNLGWRNHSNLIYGNPAIHNAPLSQQLRLYQAQLPFQASQQAPQNQGMSLEDMVKSLATNTLQFQQKTRTTIKNLET
ncbi:DNA-directed DNA polymerase [Quillaja saponaria]|uniref:DNA-directed DNA polymerase n=1 Tax=Quillaja saponaria TaxID=32244 RepID=A0AAD7M3M0_QUISA|nr:DNA-directed DNA polymerase [Quillaja saponaria]